MIPSFFLGALLGAPWVLSFAPLSQWWLGLALLAALSVLAVRVKSIKQAFVLGLGFGWSAYGVGVSWLFISLHTHGGLPAGLAVLAVAAFALYLAVFPALVVVAYRFVTCRFFQSNTVCKALLWAALWSFSEWLRGTFLTGFSWLSLGDALVDSPFSGLLAWLGSYGALGVLMVCGHMLLALVLDVRQATVRHGLGVLLFTGAVVVLLMLPVHTRSAGGLPVAAVQPNVGQSMKFDPDLIVSNMETIFSLGDLAQRLLPDGGLLLFPETVNPLVWADTPAAWRARFRDFAQPDKSTVLMGSIIQDQDRYFNSIVQWHGHEQGDALLVPQKRHDKHHLVPFGEFIPFGFGWFVSLLNMPMGEFTRGGGVEKPLTAGAQVFASTVCYEDIFGGEFAQRLMQGPAEPTVLLNVSNLAWFGQSWALDQHAQMGRTRSAEHRKPGLRVTNTGLSGLVDEFGQWQKKVNSDNAVVWTAQVDGRLGRTFFAQWGATVWFVMWGAVLVLLLARHGVYKAYNTRTQQKE